MRKHGFKIVIIVGVLLVAGYVGYYLATYPWGIGDESQEELNQKELPDATLPPFDFIESTPPPSDGDPQGNAGPDAALAAAGVTDGAAFASTGVTDIGFPRGGYVLSDFWAEPSLAETDRIDTGAEFIPLSQNTPLSGAAEEDGAEEEPIVLIATIKIPRLDISECILEGSTAEVLKYGIGHVEGTAVPSDEGNVCIAAHRTSNNAEPFKYLDKMKVGDQVEIKHWNKKYVYEVYESFIVSVYDVWVMEAVEGVENCLTMITCDPLIHLGNRPNRLIVRAALVEVSDIEEE